MPGDDKDLPITRPRCPFCDAREDPALVERSETDQIVFRCSQCGREWTVRNQRSRQEWLDSHS